jgi:hypothetical protein
MRRIPPYAGVELAEWRILAATLRGQENAIPAYDYSSSRAPAKDLRQFLIRFFTAFRMTNAVILSVTKDLQRP